MSRPLVSVIVPTCHRIDSLALCLQRLAPGSQEGMVLLPAGERMESKVDRFYYELIVSDDGGKDNAEQFIGTEYSWANWVEGPRKGPAANRNNGARCARGEWLAFTDDDCLPSSDWLAQYCKVIDENVDREIQAMEGSIIAVGDMNSGLALCPVNLSGGCFWSANIIVERKLFERCRGFDAAYHYPALEDTDLFLRLQRYTQVLFVKEAVVEHPVRIESLFEAVRKIPRQTHAWAIHTTKHMNHFNFKHPIHILGSYICDRIAELLRKVKRRLPKEVILALVKCVVSPLFFAFFLWREKHAQQTEPPN